MSDKHFFDHKEILPSFIQQRLDSWFGVAEIESLAPSLEAWFETPLGSNLLEAEQEVIDTALNYLFGYHLMQLSIDRRAKLYEKSKINHCFGLHPMATDGKVYTATSNFESLPLESDVIDVAILHHVLEFSSDPHRLLREVARTITPHGYMVIVGFNPISLLGIRRQIARHTLRKPHQRSHAIRLSRLVDWLRLLDFTPVKIQRGLFRIPVNNRFLLNHWRWFERFGAKLLTPTGGFYLIIARKQTAAVTPIKPSWKFAKPVSGFAVGAASSAGAGSVRIHDRVGDHAKSDEICLKKSDENCLKSEV